MVKILEHPAELSTNSWFGVAGNKTVTVLWVNLENTMSWSGSGLPRTRRNDDGHWAMASAVSRCFCTRWLEGPGANEAGWEDTIQANPCEITRLLVPFGAQIPGIPAGGVPFGQSFTGGYVWHCHTLDHEDNEMMQNYEVV